MREAYDELRSIAAPKAKGISRAVTLRETNEFTRKMKVVKSTIVTKSDVVIGAEASIGEPETLRPKTDTKSYNDVVTYAE